MAAPPFRPAGTFKFAPAPTNYNKAAPPMDGVEYVTLDSTLTLAGLTINGTTTATFTAGSVADTITAKAGGGQANATQLTAQNNRITICASAADSVKLPTGAPLGTPVWVRNDGANSAQVFATSPGTINGVATGTGVALAAGAAATYRQIATDKWYSG